jgi:hypothetical protein
VQFGSSLDERFDRWDIRAAGVGEAMEQDHDRAAGFARLDVRHVGYLSDSAMINDLDIAYSLKRRDGDSELFMKRIAEKVRKEKRPAGGSRHISMSCPGPNSKCFAP